MAKGRVVLVMEAMKMDVEVSATRMVAEVDVSAGQSVESQAPLLLIRR